MIGSDRWYTNAVFYSVDCGRFVASDGDGVGDFRGLVGRLDYLDGLGVDCPWLLPFYPSPGRDDGDDGRTRMATSLLFSLTGARFVYYGEEIGVDDDLSLDGPAALRTPMQ